MHALLAQIHKNSICKIHWNSFSARVSQAWQNVPNTIIIKTCIQQSHCNPLSLNHKWSAIVPHQKSHESAALPLEHRLSTLVIVLCAKMEFRLDQSDCRSPVRWWTWRQQRTALCSTHLDNHYACITHGKHFIHRLKPSRGPWAQS